MLLVGGLALIFASCAQGPRAEHHERGGAGFNAADVMFLQMMVPHHEQGVRLVRLARERLVQPEVRTLAAAIEATQPGEARAMAGWLREWRRPLAAPPDEHAEHGGMPETSEAEFTVLARTPARSFERGFLNALIAHQDDAVQLARMELSRGEHPQVRGLAQRIEASRSAQIARMLALLGG